MKMKQLLTLTLAVTMVAGTSLTAAASAPGFNPSGQEDQTVDFDSKEKSSDTADVPVYGYVGPDAVLIDPEPTEPDSKPDPTNPEEVEYQINVSVPVKILWAVFDSDVDGSGIGTVTSPDYYIRNNSEQLEVAVSATSFAAQSGNPDNTYVDGNWTEALTLTSQNSFMIRNAELNKTNIHLGNLRANEQMEFNITGKLDVDAVDTAFKAANGGATIMEDDYSNVLQPDYDLVLTITAL